MTRNAQVGVVLCWNGDADADVDLGVEMGMRAGASKWMRVGASEWGCEHKYQNIWGCECTRRSSECVRAKVRAVVWCRYEKGLGRSGVEGRSGLGRCRRRGVCAGLEFYYIGFCLRICVRRSYLLRAPSQRLTNSAFTTPPAHPRLPVVPPPPISHHTSHRRQHIPIHAHARRKRDARAPAYYKLCPSNRLAPIKQYAWVETRAPRTVAVVDVRPKTIGGGR
ncbi:hypothetical protein DENSPDRAFT_584519 [Dentipellis sp. KUC8613]|nr:hypothetical protein DENSPDRAFT_584519 [Dentipellis sp. KUC8613]